MSSTFKIAAISAAITIATLQLVTHGLPEPEHTAYIDFKGEIADSTGMKRDFMDSLTAAFENPKATGIVVYANSPGGSPVLSDEMYSGIRSLKQKHAKPITFVVGEVCASGCYYVAAAADEIVVNSNSIVGSIGVVAQQLGFDQLLERVGVEVRVTTAGDNKAMHSSLLPETEQSRLHLEATLKYIHANFIAAVQEGRGQRLKYHPEMFSGLVWTGAEAEEMGLVDRVGTLESVLKKYKNQNTVDYTVQQSAVDTLVAKFGVSVGIGVLSQLKAVTQVY